MAVGCSGRSPGSLAVDAQDSLAACQQFTEQIGLITAAFYTPTGTARAIGTTFGEDRKKRIEEGEDIECGNLLAVVHIRYVEPEALK